MTSSSENIEFARQIDGCTILHWSHSWPRIIEVERAGLVRVSRLNAWMSKVEAISDAAPSIRIGLPVHLSLGGVEGESSIDLVVGDSATFSTEGAQ